MRGKLLAAAAFLGLCLSTGPGTSQGLEVETVIAGLALQCQDFRGRPVRTYKMAELGDVGSARIIGRLPIILLDPDRLAKLPDKLQLFFFGHECGHHVLGHSFAQTVWSENEADCWSIKNGRDRGLFTRADVESWAPYFARSRGSASGHLPGPERAKRLVACYDDPTEELVEPREAQQAPSILSAGTGG